MKNTNILDLSVRDLVGKLLPQIDGEFGIIKEPEIFEKKDLVNYIHFHTKGYDKRLAKSLYEDVIECKLNHEFYVFPKLANMWGSEEITILDKGGKEQDIYFYEDLGMIMNAYTDEPYDIVDWGKHKYKFKCQNYKDLINNQDVFSYIQKSEFEKLLKEYIYTYYSPLFWYVLDLIKEIAEDLIIYATSTPNQMPEDASISKNKGRPIKMICECVNNHEEVDKVLEILHKNIDGKKDKIICLPILAMIKLGYMTRPTYNQVVREFGKIITKSNYNSYMVECKFRQNEIDGICKKIAQELK